MNTEQLEREESSLNRLIAIMECQATNLEGLTVSIVDLRDGLSQTNATLDRLADSFECQEAQLDRLADFFERHELTFRQVRTAH